MKEIKKRKTMFCCVLLVLALILLPAEVFAAKAVSIKLNKSKVTINVGGQTKLTAAVTGKSKTVTWKSSNPKVAAVNKNGKITGKKTGKVTITAKANGKTAKCVVTVKKNNVKALYKKFLEKGTGTNAFGSTSSMEFFCLLDIDQNGTPELIVSDNDGSGRSNKGIYSVKNGKVIYCGGLGGWGVNYSSKYKAICEVNGTPGSWKTLFRLSKYKLTSFKFNALYIVQFKEEYHFGNSRESSKIVSKKSYEAMEKKYFSNLKECSLYANTKANRDVVLK